MRTPLLAAACLAPAAMAAPVTYQGRLETGGSPANGLYDVRFTLYDDLAPGAPDTVIDTKTVPGVPVSGGLFTAEVPFEFPAFDGGPRYVEIAVRPTGGGGFTALSPRQHLTDAPHARHAEAANRVLLPSFSLGSAGGANASVFTIQSDDGIAIQGLGQTWGVLGLAGDLVAFPSVPSPGGVYGHGENSGVTGVSIDGYGVYGYSQSGNAGHFLIGSQSNREPALFARTVSTQSQAFGVHGLISSQSPGSSSAGLRGENRGIDSRGIGVWGSHDGEGWGVYGQTDGPGRGVYGASSGSGGAGVYGAGFSGARAGYFSGNVHVTGTLSKGAGSFTIDHPLDPANKYLSHSFVESPDMKNIYDGVATLDADGRAEVVLPGYFEALNRDFRYQLTCLGGHAPVFVEREISANAFVIAGGTPGLRVSWQVTGTRQDAYARANPIPVEEVKPEAERGRYLHPEAFGRPNDLAIGVQPPTN